jgi:L-amino acid N-acyltransferase YncA
MLELAPFGREDWKEVKAILADGLATGLAAFRLTPPIWRDWDSGHLALGRLAARDSDGRMVGWAALSPAPDT